MKHNRQHTGRAWTTIFAFAAVYLIWGSTYLAIHFAIKSIPPLMMLGVRFGMAGLVLFGVMSALGVARPGIHIWKNAILIGTLTLAVGTGAVAWAEEYVASGIAALLITTVPLFMVLLDWKWKKARRPNAAVFGGLALGVFGIILLVNPVEFLSGASIETTVAMIVILIGSFSWSYGSILSRDLTMPDNPFMSTALQMIGGGLVLVLAGLIRGEAADLDIMAITTESWLAWGYLFFFGSIVAFSSYVWLTKNVPPGQLSTYAYVNPVVAVLLGWMLAGETLNGRVVLAMLVLVSAVVLISRYGGRTTAARRPLPIWFRKESWMYALDRPAQSSQIGTRTRIRRVKDQVLIVCRETGQISQQTASGQRATEGCRT